MNSNIGAPVGENIFCWQLFEAGPAEFIVGNMMNSSKQYLLEATEQGMKVSALAKEPDSIMPEIMRMFCSRGFDHLMKGGEQK